MTSRPLRIACLHGYLQNGELFRQKMGALRKSLQRSKRSVRSALYSNDATFLTNDEIALAEFICLDAPFLLEERQIQADNQKPKTQHDMFYTIYSPSQFSNSNHSNRTNGSVKDGNHTDNATIAKRSWWEAEQDYQVYNGCDRSVEYLGEIFREMKFDGVLGFSQGAVIASLLCIIKNSNSERSKNFSSLRFAIIVSGLISKAKVHKSLYNEPIEIPSMHIWGGFDKIVPPDWSRQLMERFTPVDRANIIHEKGHMVPSDAASRRHLSRFLLDISDGMNDNLNLECDERKETDKGWKRSAL